MKYIFVKLPMSCGCIFARKTFDARPESEKGVFVEADMQPKIVWVYVSPSCTKVEHEVMW